MNIFYLSSNPEEAARYHCDKHVVKMCVEYCQLLSTAHRLIDGKKIFFYTPRKKTIWIHPTMDDNLMKATHYNHPSAKWARQTAGNYKWLFCLLVCLCKEYTERFGKIHKVEKEYLKYLVNPPEGIKNLQEMTPIPLAMKSHPECMNPNDPITSYRMFYKTKKERFKLTWKNRPIPDWF